MLAALFDPCRGAALTEIFREIDEELRLEKLQRVWRRYGVLIVGIALGLVLGTAAYVGWQSYTESQQAERGRAFAAALEQSAGAGATAALTAFEELSEGGDAYAALSRLQLAGAKLRSGDTAGATALFDKLSKDDSVDRPFRDLATVLLALNSLDTAEPDALIARLAPLTAPDSPWRYSAQELTALLAMRKGDTARAREILTALTADATAPAGVQQRAAELLGSLEG